MKSNLNIKFQAILLLAVAILVFLIGYSFAGSNSVSNDQSQERSSLDQELKIAVGQSGVTRLNLGPSQDPAAVELGEALFFDKILSGNKDISCATCHHPTLATGDGLLLPIGTGGHGLGPQREIGEGREFVPRNAPELFNRGAPEWHTMFWDGRVEVNRFSGSFISPAQEKLPGSLTNVLAIQSMFPPTSRDEMRGGLIDVSGYGNELAAITDEQSKTEEMEAIWDGLITRLLEIEEYRILFQAAFPDTHFDQLGFEHAAMAMAAFEIDAFSFDDSAWDRYLSGDLNALSSEEKDGAFLFYGRAGCSNCHSGNLMTDQEFHNIAVPQFGPGKLENGIDPGRFQHTDDPADMCAFRTPPLRNVALTAPYMHNGAFNNLEDVIRHHASPQDSLTRYQPDQLPPEISESYQGSTESLTLISNNISPKLQDTVSAGLTDEEIELLITFLNSLTSPTVLAGLPAPSTVPSGLSVED